MRRRPRAKVRSVGEARGQSSGDLTPSRWHFSMYFNRTLVFFSKILSLVVADFAALQRQREAHGGLKNGARHASEHLGKFQMFS